MATSSLTMAADGCARRDSETKFRKILVVLDPTVEQHPCIEKAIRIATCYHSAVELLMCDTEQSVPAGVEPAVNVLEYRKHLQSRHQTRLEGLAGPLRAAGLTVTTAAIWNADLPTGIGQHAIRCKADLVVKDTHHHQPMPRVHMSHTDATLIRQVPSALLLVQQRAWPPIPRLAVAVDPTQPAERSVEIDDALVAAATSMSDAIGGALEVVHVLRDPPHLPDEAVTDEQRSLAAAQSRSQVQDLIERHRANALVHFPDGPVAQSLLTFTSRHGVDVLVMGAAARSRWVNAIPGGTAAQLLEHVSCDLLVVKQPGFVSGLLATD